MVNNRKRRVSRHRSEVERFTLSDYIRLIAENQNGLFATYGGYTQYGNKPTERIENSFTGYISGGYKSDPIVFACMMKRASVFSEARFVWRKVEKDGAAGDVFVDEALGVLSRPWPNGTTGELLSRMIQDVDLAGNFYAVNEGDRLRRLRPDWVQIVLSGDPLTDADVDVMGYTFTPGGPDSGGDTKVFSPDEVCHWSPVPDPDALYRGMSWLTPVVREILGDKAATDHKLAFFRNGATLGPIVKVPAGMTAAQFKEFIAASEQAHAGVDNAYRTFYVGGGADVTLGMSTMQQMDFKAVQGHYETRICAAAQVPAVLAGISEGLAGSSLNAGNYSSAKRSYADGWCRPTWRSACAALSTIVEVPDDAELWFDERNIAFLREDAKDLAQIQQTQASTMSTLITAGFEPETAVTAVGLNDWAKLKHTGLTSVQLMAPGSQAPDANGAPPADAPAEPIDFGALRAKLGDEDDIERAFDPNQLRIGAGKHGGGRWTRMSDFATALLRDWAKGEGSDDPLGEHDFSSTQLQSILRDLRKAHADDPARVARLTPPRARAGMSERQKVDALKTVLYKDVGAHVRGNRDSDVGPRQAKFTLIGGRTFDDRKAGRPSLRDKDVAVYRDPQGKPALFFEDEHGNRGGLVEKFDSLDDLHAWASERGETRLAEWADKERGGTALAKATPRKATPELDVEATRKRIEDLRHQATTQETLASMRLGNNRPGSFQHKQGEANLEEADRLRSEADALETSIGGPAPAAPEKLHGVDLDVLIEEAGLRGKTPSQLKKIADENNVAIPAVVKTATARQKFILETLMDHEKRRSGNPDIGVRRLREASEQLFPSATPKPTPDAPDLDSLRQLGDPEAIRDALDLRKVDELKAMLREQKLPVSGRKRELVDRLVEHVGGGEAAPGSSDMLPGEGPVDYKRRKRTEAIVADLAGVTSRDDAERILAQKSLADLRFLAREHGVDVKTDREINGPRNQWKTEQELAADLAGLRARGGSLRGESAPDVDAGKVRAPKATVRPSGLPADRKPESGDFDDLADRVSVRMGMTEAQRLEIFQDLNASELRRLARKFAGTAASSSLLGSNKDQGLRIPDGLTTEEKRVWLAKKLSEQRFFWRSTGLDEDDIERADGGDGPDDEADEGGDRGHRRG